jgi:putative NADH-flavin reductase
LDEYKDKIVIKKVDIYSVDSISEAINGADVIISQLGSGSVGAAMDPTDLYSTSARNILAAMKKQSIKRVLLTSSAGCEYDENFSWIYRAIVRRLIMNTYMDMARLETIVEESYTDMDWTILRPSYLINAEKNKKFFARERQLRHGSYQITRKDFAKFCVHEAENGLWIKGHPAVGYL